MSPIVFVLGLTSWLSTHCTIPLPVQDSNLKSIEWKSADWKPRTPIPSAPDNAAPSYDRVLVQAMMNGELQVKNRTDFNRRMKQFTANASKISVSKSADASTSSNSKYSLEIKTKPSSEAHIGYCVSFVKTMYASCGVWIPASSFTSIQSFGSLVAAKSSLKIGDLIYVDRTASGSTPHVGIYLGDGHWKHPGHPNLPDNLQDLSRSGFKILMIKRIVA